MLFFKRQGKDLLAVTIIRKTTRELIIEAFEAQLKTTSFENIRVASICQECGIQRPHFYYYFNDKYDLSVCYYMERIHKTMETALATQASFRELIEINLHTVLENKSVYQHLMRYRGPSSLFTKMLRFTQDGIEMALKLWNGPLKLTDSETEHLKFYCHAVNSISLTWYMEDMAIPPDELVELVCNNIPEDLRKYFR